MQESNKSKPRKLMAGKRNGSVLNSWVSGGRKEVNKWHPWSLVWYAEKNLGTCTQHRLALDAGKGSKATGGDASSSIHQWRSLHVLSVPFLLLW